VVGRWTSGGRNEIRKKKSRMSRIPRPSRYAEHVKLVLQDAQGDVVVRRLVIDLDCFLGGLFGLGNLPWFKYATPSSTCATHRSEQIDIHAAI
jgi:hypothetical protein